MQSSDPRIALRNESILGQIRQLVDEPQELPPSDQEIGIWADTLPEHGEWWHEGGREVFTHAAKRLLGTGMTWGEIAPMLEGLYSTVAGEFGN